MPAPDDLAISTRLIHEGEDANAFRAVTNPIYQTSLFTFEHLDELLHCFTQPEVAPPHHYSRLSNPTTDAAARKIAMLEGAEAAKMTATGQAAIALAVFANVRAGSHVVCPDTVYRPGRNLLDYLGKFGVTTTLVDGRNPDEIRDAVRPETTLIYLESPSSIVFRLQDVRAVTSFARERGITTMIDNTYATPLNFQPLAHGVDVVCHSATKYFGGHSDLTAGVVASSRERMDRMTAAELDLVGSHLPPFPAWLVTRGLRTLPLRLRQHEATANTVAAWLEGRPEVERVHHLGLDSFPQRDLVLRDFRGTTGLFSFEPKRQDPDAVKAFVDALQLFARGVSWGGYESLVIAMPVQAIGLEGTRWFVRLFCGLEEPADLIRDLERALPHLSV
jgi:cystathionine beta-lyase